MKIIHIANNRSYIDTLEVFAPLVKLEFEPNEQPKQKASNKTFDVIAQFTTSS